MRNQCRDSSFSLLFFIYMYCGPDKFPAIHQQQLYSYPKDRRRLPCRRPFSNPHLRHSLTRLCLSRGEICQRLGEGVGGKSGERSSPLSLSLGNTGHLTAGCDTRMMKIVRKCYPFGKKIQLLQFMTLRCYVFSALYFGYMQRAKMKRAPGERGTFMLSFF